MSTYDKINELMDRHEDAFMILGGDSNAWMRVNDTLNRCTTANEVIFADYIRSNNSTCEVMDTYRSIVKEGGYAGQDNYVSQDKTMHFINLTIHILHDSYYRQKNISLFKIIDVVQTISFGLRPNH